MTQYDPYYYSYYLTFCLYVDFYKNDNSDSLAKDFPKKIDDSQKYTVQDTRLFVNSLIELSKTMPDLKAKTIENNDQLASSIAQNKQTINAIQSTQQSL
jgi:hypothetical protein